LLGERDERTDGGGLVEPVTEPQRGHSLRETVGELVVDVIVNEDAVGRGAGRSPVAHLGQHRAFDGHVEIRIVEDDEWGVATEFHRAVDDTTCRLLQEHRPHTRGSREREFANLAALQHCLDGITGRIGYDDVHHALGDSG
jgi:hypothetical protein